MFYQRAGFPEEDEIVLCTVKTVQYHSVFVTLDHFHDVQGLVHISEVSPGRIRNIREFVVEGKKVWCKVLKINRDKGNIDLSLRRVNESQKRLKNDQLKQEQRAEKIIEIFAEQQKLKAEDAYTRIAKPLLQEYDFVFEAFVDIMDGKTTLAKLGVPKEHTDSLLTLIKEKITPKTYDISGTISLKSFDENGIAILKNALHAAKRDKIEISYLGGGKYSLSLVSRDVKEAERIVKEATDACKQEIEKTKGFFEFKRKE